VCDQEEERESVCVIRRKRERESVCVIRRKRERESNGRERVCVYVRER
jgi:hypothetical protein